MLLQTKCRMAVCFAVFSKRLYDGEPQRRVF